MLSPHPNGETNTYLKPRCFALTATDIGKSCPRFSCEVSTRGKSPSEWWRNLVCWGVWTTSLPNTGSTMCECASIAIASWTRAGLWMMSEPFVRTNVCKSPSPTSACPSSLMIRMTSALHTGQSGRSEASDFQFRYAPVTLGSGRENLIGFLMTIYHFSMFLLGSFRIKT